MKSRRRSAFLVSTGLVKAVGRTTGPDTPSGMRQQGRPRHDNGPLALLKAEIDAFLCRHGRRPRVLAADTGGRRRPAAVRRLASALADMGFDVDLAPDGLHPDALTGMALENDVHFVFAIVDPSEADTAGFQALSAAGIQLVAADAVGDWRWFLEQDMQQDKGAVYRHLAAEFGPRLTKIAVRRNPPAYFIEGVLAGNRRILAQGLTLMESTQKDHRKCAKAVIRALLPKTGQALRMGISGVPGVGKSTFIESFGQRLVRKGHRVAVLAVDPSSVRNGGSILGDKTRMTGLSSMPRAFVRPSPAGGALGGVADRTRECMVLCEAAGFDVVIVETVGVGQSEISVASMVDFFLVLMLAGAGDEIQGIKKGILELADAVAVNKADGDNVEAAGDARRDYESALTLLSPSYANWRTPVLTCSAVTGEGLDETWEVVQAHQQALYASGELPEKRRQQALAWMQDLVEEGLQERLLNHPQVVQRLPQIVDKVVQGDMLATQAAREILALADTGLPGAETGE